MTLTLQRETVSIPVDTYEAAKTAPVDIEKIYEYASINMLLSVIAKKGGTVTEKIEFTYDSEDNRSTKKVTNADGERIEYYYYDGNGDLVSVSQQVGIDPIENLLNIYRDANGQLLSFEYKGQIFYNVYNQRGDIVAITDELQAVIAKYTYDEWGNIEKIDAPTPLGAEVANANPFRYVGKFGVQYDNDTKIYYMGWRDYDSKVGRFIVADEYEGEDNNPISFNRYLYAEADPVNNIDPDGYAPKWLKKVFKGVKKGAKAAYNIAIGDDIRTLTSKKTKWYKKAGAAVMIATNFVPFGGVIAKAAKVAIKGTSKAVKAYKASKAVTKATKIVRTTSKKVVAKVNKKPKTVPAKSFRSSPKTQNSTSARSAIEKENHYTINSKSKSVVSGNQRISQKPTRVEEHLLKEPAAGDNIGVNLRAKGTGNFANKNFASRDLLESHYEKHAVKNNEFHGAYSEYMQGARDVMISGTKVGYQYKGETRTGYAKFMGNSRKGEAKFEFVGTNANGDVTTYHVKRGEDLWKLLNNNKRDKTINPME